MAFFEIDNVKIVGLSAGVPSEIRYIKDEGNISSDYGADSFIESTFFLFQQGFYTRVRKFRPFLLTIRAIWQIFG